MTASVHTPVSTEAAAAAPENTSDHTPALVVTDLRVAYRSRSGRVTEAVRGASLTVRRGETVALVGESGSGKTTLAHAVVGLLPGSASRTAGSIVLAGQDISAWPEHRLVSIRGRAVGLVPQDPGTALNPVQRVGVQVVEAMRLHHLVTRRAAPARAVELLAAAGLEDPEAIAQRYPHELSGGQRQRVLIAAALSCDPALVVADEPTSALDVTVQKTVLDHLQERTRAAGAAMLFITHDLAVAAERADRVVVLRGGEVVEEGTAAQVLAAPRHPYTRALVAAAPSLNAVRLTPRVVEGGVPDSPVGESQAERVRAASSGEPVLTVEHLTKDFGGRAGRNAFAGRWARTAVAPVRAVDDVSFTVRRGSTLALVGQSGSGKTTTARIVARLERATSGAVRVGGQDLAALRGEKLRQARRTVQLVHQNPTAALDPRQTVGAIVEAPLRAFGIGEASERAAAVREVLDHVALPADTIDRLPAELSGGQRQRVAIARAVVVRPELLVLDEPVSALDVSVQEQILRLLVDLQAQYGLTYLFITHDLAVVRQVADEVAVMHRGQIVEHGSVAQVYEYPADAYTRELLAAIPGREALSRAAAAASS